MWMMKWTTRGRNLRSARARASCPGSPSCCARPPPPPGSPERQFAGEPRCPETVAGPWCWVLMSAGKRVSTRGAGVDTKKHATACCFSAPILERHPRTFDNHIRSPPNVGCRHYFCFTFVRVAASGNNIMNSCITLPRRRVTGISPFFFS